MLNNKAFLPYWLLLCLNTNVLFYWTSLQEIEALSEYYCILLESFKIISVHIKTYRFLLSFTSFIETL